MYLTNAQVLGAVQRWSVIANKDLTYRPAISQKLLRIGAELDTIIRSVQAVQQDLLERYADRHPPKEGQEKGDKVEELQAVPIKGEKNDDGSPKMDMRPYNPPRYKLSPENTVKFDKDFADLMNAKSYINVRGKIKPEDQRTDLNVGDAMLFSWLFEMVEEGEDDPKDEETAEDVADKDASEIKTEEDVADGPVAEVKGGEDN